MSVFYVRTVYIHMYIYIYIYIHIYIYVYLKRSEKPLANSYGLLCFRNGLLLYVLAFCFVQLGFPGTQYLLRGLKTYI